MPEAKTSLKSASTSSKEIYGLIRRIGDIASAALETRRVPRQRFLQAGVERRQLIVDQRADFRVAGAVALHVRLARRLADDLAVVAHLAADHPDDLRDRKLVVG